MNNCLLVYNKYMQLKTGYLQQMTALSVLCSYIHTYYYNSLIFKCLAVDPVDAIIHILDVANRSIFIIVLGRVSSSINNISDLLSISSLSSGVTALFVCPEIENLLIF